MENILRTIDASNVDRYGFFCYKSKPKSAGYRHKRLWLERSLAEGLRITILYEANRSAGFIEYAPAEAAWRVLIAPGYMVVHCMWVVGSSKGKGYGARLLEHAESTARSLGMHGLVTVSSDSTWLAKSGFYLHQGFQAVDQAPPAFELLVKRFGQSPLPTFPRDWNQRLERLPHGLVVYYSGQCPYHQMFVNSLGNAANQMGLPLEIVELKTSQEARALSPTAHGVFGVVYKGCLLSYRPIGGKTLRQILESSHD